MLNDLHADSGEPLPAEAPVFILTASRSGSTLLRFILDSHPDLACPPETTIGSAFTGLARLWDVLENAESGQGRPINEPASLSPQAAAAVREAVDQAFAPYLERRGKSRWCDKSLDSFLSADLIAQVYPEAKFICLFRHCMDVIASGVEACPWGLHRYGFDPFVAQHPGNSVAAIGGYWQSSVQAIMAFAEKHQRSCHRVRYEDLVTAPESAIAAIFSFLGVDQVPGIAQACFQTAHEGGGPGDEKIWFTTGISAGSLGRGVSVPAAALPAPLLGAINETLPKLGYRVVDENWNSSVGPADPRAGTLPAMPGEGPAGHPHDAAGIAIEPAVPASEPVTLREDQSGRRDGHGAFGRAELDAVLGALIARIASRDEVTWREINAAWPGVAGVTAMLVVQSPHGDHHELRLRFPPVEPARADAAWGVLAEIDAEPSALMIADPTTWRSLLDGTANLAAEVLSGRLRCVNKLDGYRIRSAAIHAIATLIGVARIPTSRHAPARDPGAPGVGGQLARASSAAAVIGNAVR